ncbi:hypothetical protein MNBD_IGNAVI01-2734 [hydrothermal vent metagenome]|uniref:Uncharacterized protein n=1 Tax=hydrothermal vent metagenome TaxID=652676 RepID=A0A3B1C4P6_9ZZZZ
MKMWGSSPTDVWAVGPGSDRKSQIIHFNGTTWIEKGKDINITPWCIYGFSIDDVWMGGQDGKIWHYDGNNWSEKLSYNNELNFRYYDIVFMDIWGENPNDIYAVGLVDSSDVGLGDVRFGLLMHYDGSKWSRVNIECFDETFMKIRKSKCNKNYFIWSYLSQTNPDSSKYYEYNRKEFKEIYYDEDSPHNITVINDEVLFSFNDAIYCYSNSSFNLIIQNPYPNAWNTVFGRHRNDLIWTMSDGLTHYNGADFKYILNFENKSLADGVVFEDEVFFVANDFYNNDANNLIYHGVLK